MREKFIPKPSGSSEELIRILNSLKFDICEAMGKRKSFFTIGRQDKRQKLQAVQDWLEQNTIEDKPEQQNYILTLIRDICAIKRNPCGLFKPESLQEFLGALRYSGFQLPLEKNYSFSSLELKKIKSMSDIDEIIKTKTEKRVNNTYS